MKKILIVDDATTVRMYYRDILEQAGFTVEEAVNGLEALEKALAQAFDLVVVDINMPVMDGYAFMRALRKEPTLRALPAIMISTEAEEQDAARAYGVGANFYLVKPVQPATFILHVRLLTGELAP